MNIDSFIASFEEVLEVDNGTVKAECFFREFDEWDSITLLSLIAMLEDDYDVIIPRKEFDEIKTIQELFDFVNKNK